MIRVAWYLEPYSKFISEGMVEVLIDSMKYNVKLLGADQLCVIDNTGLKFASLKIYSDAEIEVPIFSTIEEVEAAHREGTHIYFDDPKSLAIAEIPYTYLEDYDWPEGDISFYFGKNFGGIPYTGREDKTWLAMQCGNLWTAGAIPIALYYYHLRAGV